MTTGSATDYDPDLGNKFLFVTGGVMSGLGKGITAASTGRLLKDAGLDVTAVKIDPYINVDAGTMNPFQHGEVYVLKDGTEVDLDLGNYERFLHTDMTSANNITTGKVYRDVIEKERGGEYLGETVQIIPHVTDAIKRKLREEAEGHDICIVEVGGTVGDIEGMPFLEALRQFEQEQRDEDYLHMHVTLVPYSPNGEQKTKPTQHSVKELRSIGIQPDMVVGRCDEPLNDKTKEKIALFCDVPHSAVISNPDVEDIYHAPQVLEKEGLSAHVLNELGLEEEARTDETSHWEERVNRTPDSTAEIALVGKYPLEDAYLSIREALKHAGMEVGVAVDVTMVNSEMLSEQAEQMHEADGIIVPGGFGKRGIDGKITAAGYARKNDVPYLGLCLGFQMAVIEYARNVLGLDGAHSAEMDESTPHPVIDILPEQKEIDDMGGTMRLGQHETSIKPGTRAHEIYGDDSCRERHRHRYEVNPEYIDDLTSGEMTFSGTAGRRMEILELEEHPFFIGTQFHPEFRSRPDRPSPPFVEFLESIDDSD